MSKNFYNVVVDGKEDSNWS